MYGRSFDVKNIKAQMVNGVNLALILHCFGKRVDLSQIFLEPNSKDQNYSNLGLVFTAIEKAKIKIFLTLEEYSGCTDEEFFLLQIYQIYKAFKDQVPSHININMILFKDGKRMISLNESASTCSVFSIASESLDYSRSTIALSQLPSEANLTLPQGFFSQFTPKFSSNTSTER